MIHKNFGLFFILFLGIFISSCAGGNGGSNTSSANFTPMPLVWENCTATKYPTISAKLVTYFGPRLQCSMMLVPINYNDQSEGYLSIAISRVKASAPQNRIGSMFMNPGGPGGSGLGFAPTYAEFFELASSNMPGGPELHKLTEVYDFIGFDPRGVGSSTNLICQLNAFYQQELLATEDRSQTNFDSIYYNQQLDANACQKNNLTKFINSDTTARDMDVARQLLGDEKLNYYGYSYGTWLGIWYASLFPEHINHIVLDSTLNYTKTLVDNNQAVPMQFVFDNIIIPYAAQNPESFNLGESVGDIQNIFSTLNIKLQTSLSNQLYLYLFSQKTVNTAVEYLMSAKAINAITTANPTISEANLLLALESYPFTPNSTINSITITLAQTLATKYMKLVTESPEHVILAQNGSFNDAVNKTVSCNDANGQTAQGYWDGIINTIYPIAPAYFHDRYEQNCTSNWNGATVRKPSTANASGLNNILMVQDQYDAATALPGALATYNMLGNASLIYNTNSYSHGVFPTGTTCVDNTVINYLLSPTSNNHFVAVCEGHGLIPPTSNILDKTQAISELPAKMMAKASKPVDKEYISQSYSNPKQADELLNEIHQQIDKAARN